MQLNVFSTEALTLKLLSTEDSTYDIAIQHVLLLKQWHSQSIVLQISHILMQLNMFSTEALTFKLLSTEDNTHFNATQQVFH